jgi:hypothetical protein
VGAKFVGAAGSVYTATDVTLPPLPVALIDVIVNVYCVPAVSPVIVSVVPLILCDTPELGDAATEYVTPVDLVGAVHESDIRVVAMDANMGTDGAAGSVRTALDDAVVPPLPEAFTDCMVNV